MTERSLLVRCAQKGRYFAVGMDFPSARVFDVATGNLSAVINVPSQNRSSLAVVSLTSLSLGIVDGRAGENRGSRKHLRRSQKNVDDALHTTFAAVGLSNGTLLLHNVGKDELVGHLCVSETQQPIVATTFAGRFVFCVTADHLLHVVDCLMGERIVTNLRVQRDASAVAAMEDIPSLANEVDFTPEYAFCVFVSGPTNALYRLRISNTATESDVHGAHTTANASLDRLLTFASHASRTDVVWMGGTPQQPVVVTSSSQEGAVRVWDARPTLDRAKAPTRCHRSLICGQRIVDISVSEGTHSGSDRNHGDGDGPSDDTDTGMVRAGGTGKLASGEALVVATTFTGTVLVWMLGRSLLVSVVESMPKPPTFQLTSEEVSGRLLFASLLPGTNALNIDSSSSQLSLLLLRGRFAVPQFEVLDLREAAAKAVRLRGSAASRRRAALVASGEDVAVYFVPCGEKSGARSDAFTHSELEMVDHAWSTHDRQQRRRIQLAARARNARTEGFVPTVSFHAKSVKELPQRSLTLEQRLKQLQVSQSAPQAAGQQQNEHQHALGLATVPLYQALHANDTSAVMELLTVASRSAGDIRATVMSLQLPYCLQLLQLLYQRLRGASPCSPLFQWVDAIMRYRGVEMYHVQQNFKQNTTSVGSDKVVERDASTQPSPPKDFVAPLLHQYRNLVSLYDQIAVMYGRLSIFKSVFPSERNVFVNSHDGIIFPAMFVEQKYVSGGYLIRDAARKSDPLSSKRGKNRKARDSKGKKKAVPHARREDGKESTVFTTEDDAGDGDADGTDNEELDSDQLDEMVLSDGGGEDGENLEEESEGDEEKDEELGRKKKRARGEEVAAMLAESERGSSYGAESRHGGEEDFDSGSDEELGLAAPKSGRGDDDTGDGDESSGSSGDSNVSDEMQDGQFDDDDEYDIDDDDLDEEDDGIGSDVAELLSDHGQGEDASDDEERHELRRYKRAKTDG